MKDRPVGFISTDSENSKANIKGNKSGEMCFQNSYICYIADLVFTNTTENQSGSRSAVTMIKIVINNNLVKERSNFNFGFWVNRVHNDVETRHGIGSLKLG